VACTCLYILLMICVVNNRLKLHSFTLMCNNQIYQEQSFYAQESLAIGSNFFSDSFRDHQVKCVSHNPQN